MRLGSRSKVALGGVTLLPLIAVPALVLGMMATFNRVVELGPAATPGDLSGSMAMTFALIGVLTILSLALLVVYALHAAKNERLDQTMRIVWVLLFFFAGQVAMPIYFVLQIWPDDPETRRTRPPRGRRDALPTTN